jgi:hypothetical protein
MSFDPTNTQVYINCGGKSGSKTLEKTLSQHFKCLHTHGNFYFQKQVTQNTNYTLYDAITKSMDYFDQVYIIDSYRHPIERAISSCFQTKPKTTLETFNYNLLIGENYSCLEETLYEFGIKFTNKFDFKKKYFLTKYKNVNIIKIRFSDINEWGTILSDIFNMPITMRPDNLSQNKSYYDNYLNVLQNIKIPKHYFRCLINSREFKTFNTLDETNKYINKWKPQLAELKVDISQLPKDFDWKVYVDINKGRLQTMNELEVCIHYAQTGRLEGKKYKH